jgi:cell division protein FtsI (penicillin-binding protein 3)
MTIQQRRTIVLASFLTAWAVVVVARLVQIQIVRHDDYVTRAAKQHERTLTLTPVRGAIRDARGRVFAESVSAESIYADPQAIADPKSAARALASIRALGLERAVLESKLRARSEFAWIARQVDASVATSVRNLKIEGIYTLEEHKRWYPKGTLAAPLLGYVGIDGEGLAGIEHSFDRFARGRAGKVTLLRDARRGMYLVGAEGPHAPVDGNDVYLTIDEVVQFIAERAVRRSVEQYDAVSGTAIVMDPNDGSILAMATWPAFDPNSFRAYPASRWRNRAVQDLYEPGSTFKIVVAAGGLEEGLVTPSDMIDCGDGSIQVANIRIREHDGNRYGVIPFEDVLAQSSNVGTVRVGTSLGKRRLHDYAQRFGFGDRTGVELPGEAVGILRPVEKWSAVSNAEIAIGQEIGVTPLQMLQAFAIVANGGRRITPRIVDRVVDARGQVVYEPRVERGERVISEKTAAVLNAMLKTVVARGTGKAAAVPEYIVAGKTGTAQKATRGGYSLDKYVGSFAGYVPADRPRIAILVTIDEPKGQHYGSVVAAPAFREIAEGTLRYLGVPPSLPGRSIDAATPRLAAFSQPHTPAGPSSGARVVPDFRGLDGRSAAAEATRAGFSISLKGSGVVRAQTPAPGAPAERREIELVMTTEEEAK